MSQSLMIIVESFFYVFFVHIVADFVFVRLSL